MGDKGNGFHPRGSVNPLGEKVLVLSCHIQEAVDREVNEYHALPSQYFKFMFDMALIEENE